MESRDKLMIRIQMCCFYITDLNLFLDTHPHCAEALELFHKYKKMKQDAVEEYAEKYGPITIEDVKSKTEWTWATGDWPWEKGE